MASRVRAHAALRNRRAQAVVTACALLGMWQVLCVTVLAGKGVVASPSEIADSLVREASLYWANSVRTVQSAAIGWVIGTVGALLFAALSIQVRIVEHVVLHTSLTLYCLPLVALAPVLQVTLNGSGTSLALATIAVFFPTVVLAIVGLRSAPRGALMYTSAVGGGRWAAFWRVRVPAAWPAVLSAMRVGAPAALLGAVLGEFLGADSGLGVLLVNALSTLRPDRVWSIAVICTAVGSVVYWVLGLLLLRSAPWASRLADSPNQHSSSGSSRLGDSVALWSIAAVAIVILVWAAAIPLFDLSPYIVKSPGSTWSYLVSDAGAGAVRSHLLHELLTTLLDAAIGFAVGLTVGVVVAIAFVWIPALGRVLAPIAIALRTVPIVVLTPVIVLAVGRGLLSTTVITAIISFFPTLVNTEQGLRAASPGSLMLLRSYGATPGDEFRFVRLQTALPAVWASARIAAPAALFGATLAEWLATGKGLGYTIVVARAESRFDELWAGAVILTGATLALYAVIASIERRVLLRYAPQQVGG